MKKKLVIELFVYFAIVVIAIVMYFTYKPVKHEFDIPMDFQLREVKENAFIPIE